MAIYRWDTKVSWIWKGFRPENPWTEGQVLTKTATGYAYQDVEALPDWGEVWNKLAKTATWSEWVDWELVEIEADDYSAMKWPAPDGFHVPLSTEWQWLKTIMDWLSLTTWDGWRINLHMPFAGYRSSSDASILERGSHGYYWSSSPSASSSSGRARFLYMYSSKVYADWDTKRSGVHSVRCFKDSYKTPTSSWTVINGTLWWAWIFRDTVNWLISITGDGTTWYTIQDKNLWATTVYNNWDTLTQANMWNMYQWWNNYWFPSTWSVTTSSTQVDASSYWPWNYYSSSTFITESEDWSSVKNDNLRWWVTWVLNSKYAWGEKIAEVPSIWKTWQVLTKTNDGYEFQKMWNFTDYNKSETVDRKNVSWVYTLSIWKSIPSNWILLMHIYAERGDYDYNIDFDAWTYKIFTAFCWKVSQWFFATYPVTKWQSTIRMNMSYAKFTIKILWFIPNA